MSPFIDIHTHHEVNPDSTLTIRCEGVHPWLADRLSAPILYSDDIDAIGEIGLDYACNADRAAQRAAFLDGLNEAQSRSLAVVIHSVRSFEDVMLTLKERPTLPAVIFHGFIGSAQQARRAIDSGYYLSFGERTFSSPKTIAALKITPTDQLFLETDNGAMPIEEIYRHAEQIRGEELRERLFNNYIRLFR
ncbi:MAG: TatD family hydrolase [Rikenellaceae bacterium]